ncbi:TraB/GumN family protein [Dyadobacter sandarakinus]|uniref:TraB/GumN family protein n=1 Tax=Dyadobacter sandarakinus TaxID=2747268 RepID=A0ABX7IAQ8_9BACT|nr:TraB/GumN family protein [Dyadobacter sandarakinus]QRR03189.1 TraB/GumN family protein [Dyadobacter sandarakinus]
MKIALFFILTLLLFNPSRYTLKDKKGSRLSGPSTILWKITGKESKQPSYLLGTFHLADADWLYTYPEIQKAIDETEFILTEAFTTDSTPAFSIPRKDQLKAIPLLDEEQYATLDSFFIARVGEGIKGNQDAENMTVAEMRGAIITTLISETKGPNGITNFMDLDLFKYYQKLGRKGGRLDRVAPSEFDSVAIEHAREYLARSLRYIEGSDKSDWNIYHQDGIEDIISRYKAFDLDYKLDQHADKMELLSDFDFVPVEERNKNWISKITSMISTRPTLIAVGLGHLYYRTGVISLLRKDGYKVEPIILSKK